MDFINVTGYLSSGSSAVVDYIREFSNTAVCKTEIRFIRDPFGIIDLDSALTQKWENERASYAIWKFLDYSKKWQRFNRRIFSPAGHSYKKFLNKNYYKITENYIDSLVDYKAVTSHYCASFDQCYFSYVWNRLRKNLEKKTKGKFRVANRNVRKSVFSQPDENFFIEQTRNYIESLFSQLSDDNKTIILDQALPPDDLYFTHRYFRNCKNIIITRDPRDMFINDLLDLDFIWKKKELVNAGKQFVIFYKGLVKKTKIGEDPCLIIRFEDLCLNYEQTTSKISSFLKLDSNNHLEKKVYFNPDVSKHNVGIYRKYYDKYKDAIDYIYSELKDYCWNE